MLSDPTRTFVPVPCMDNLVQRPVCCMLSIPFWPACSAADQKHSITTFQPRLYTCVSAQQKYQTPVLYTPCTPVLPFVLNPSSTCLVWLVLEREQSKDPGSLPTREICLVLTRTCCLIYSSIARPILGHPHRS